VKMTPVSPLSPGATRSPACRNRCFEPRIFAI
jgi:hypothetical protein